MFNSIDFCSFIHVSCCVGKGPIALLFLGTYNAVNTALGSPPSLFIILIEKMRKVYSFIKLYI